MATDVPPSVLPSPVRAPENVPGIPPDGNGGGDQTGKQPLDKSAGGGKPTPLEPLDYIHEALNDAERLLKYAAETGVEVDSGVRDSILRARDAARLGWDPKVVGDLLEALTKLAAQLKPVTAESLRATHNKNQVHPTFRGYWIVSVCLAVCILFFSVLSFVTTAISTTIRADITTANDLAVRLRTQLGTPPAQVPATTSPASTSAIDLSQPPPGQSAVEIITELQQYASMIRAINSRSQQLNQFVFSHEQEHYLASLTNAEARHAAFQLDVGLTNLWYAETGRTKVYQHVRTFAQSVVEDVSFFYGAVAACILPVLYALFGTCAYVLRDFEQQMRARTFIPSRTKSVRFLIAAIGGAVVGLFNFTISPGASVSPLALAFLVGYAVDVFFTFLEGLLQMFTKKPSSL